MPEITNEAWQERRLKREAKRAKQRLENYDRAKKMHATRISGTVPLWMGVGGRTLPAPPTLHIGCSGWFYWHWKGLFYPESLPTNKWFQHYATRFSTVELNAPFYSWPTINTVKSWLRQIGRRKFAYTVKVCE